VKERYEQPGLHKYDKLEQILFKEHDTKQIADVIDGYTELHAESLSVQLAMMRQQQWSVNTVAELVDKLVSLPPVVR
jgi:hypothetical protein